jgi:hypothetical protein
LATRIAIALLRTPPITRNRTPLKADCVICRTFLQTDLTAA